MSYDRTGYNFTNILTATTTTVKTGGGVLKRIVINKAVATSTITIYDNTAASGTKIGIITQPAAVVQSQSALEYNVHFAIGLTIVTSSTDDITVVWA
jgi:hypothetical protein